MKNDSESLAGSTVEMSAADFELPSAGNNTPEKQLDREELELDTDSIDRLSVKPVQKYRFVRSIGRGGMKMVLQTKDLDATRDVAMAVLPEATTRPREDLVRFIQEARITASLEHPNIVPVHEIGVDSTGAPYYTMKLLRGKTLAALISKLAEGDEAFNADYNTIRLLRIFLKICNGVAFAHSKGVIHLDLKPENIQVGDFGEVLIMDWGLAKVREHLKEEKSPDFEVDHPNSGFGSGTLDGIMKGTPGYMAPEQAAGKNSLKDERTDIYSLGAILYSLMTWKDPLEEKTVKERIEATLAGKIIPPSRRAPDREIPAGVEAVIRKAMSLNPAERYQSVRELRDEVNAFIGGYATIAEKASIAKKIILFFRRHLLLSVLLAIAVFFVVVGSFYMFLEYHRDMTGWKDVFSSDFSKEKDFIVNTPGNREKRPVRHGGSNGALLNAGEWLWLDRSISGNLKLIISCSAPADTELTVAFAAQNAPLKTTGSFPAGWALRLNCKGGWNIIARASDQNTEAPQPLAVTKKGKMSGKFTFTLVKEGRRIQVFEGTDENKAPILEAEDLFPATGREQCYLGFRSQNAPVTLLKINLWLQPVPNCPAPMIRPEILEDEGLYKQAFEQYLIAAQLYPNDNFADEALARAYRIASIQLAKEPKFRQRAAVAIEKVPSFSRATEIKICDILFQWETQKYAEAIIAAEKLLKEQPDHNILLQLLSLPERNLQTIDAQRFIKLLANSNAGRELTWLDLSGFNLEDLKPIANIESLQWLDCSGNKIRSIDPLNSLPLEYINCSGNPGLNRQNLPEKIKAIMKD